MEKTMLLSSSLALEARKHFPAQRTTYGRGESGRMGTPEDGPAAFGRGESGRIGTPDESFDTFGRGESGRMGTPLANEIA